MWTRLRGGKIYDPNANATGTIRDLWICNGLIAQPSPGLIPDHDIDCHGCIVMAGAIDMHTHIGGGKVTTSPRLF